jgi:hypothetical protein
LGDGERTVQDIEGLHRMTDVDDFDVGHDAKNDALDGPNEVIVKTKISSQSDDRPLRQCSLALEAELSLNAESKPLLQPESRNGGNRRDVMTRPVLVDRERSMPTTSGLVNFNIS